MAAVRTVKLVNPVGQRAVVRGALAQRLESLNGQSIGFIDNIKPNANLFLQAVEEMMLADFKEVQTHTLRKNFTSSKLIAHEFDGKVHAVVNAWGD
jgi:hypothetical protein